MRNLEKPAGVGNDEWAAIEESWGRLRSARDASDYALVVGTAKELCESVAKVVVTERGGSLAGAPDMPDLVSAAHKLLEFQPGEGLANDPEVRKVAQGLKSIITGLGEMRNRHGTGHGRATPSGITEEHADLAFEVAMTWSTWALRRLAPYIAGNVTALVRDLDEATFSKGALARRLIAANLSHLPESDQTRLGVAVAHRAVRKTFVVHTDGISAVEPSDVSTWPRDYVRGLISGLFFDTNGYVHVSDWQVRDAARLISEGNECVETLDWLAAEIAGASRSRRVAQDQGSVDEIRQDFVEGSVMFTQPQCRERWETIEALVLPEEAS